MSGYYNPLLQYDDQKAIQHSREAGANGFIIVDLPPEEAVRFREICTSEGFVALSFFLTYRLLERASVAESASDRIA